METDAQMLLVICAPNVVHTHATKRADKKSFLLFTEVVY